MAKEDEILTELKQIKEALVPHPTPKEPEKKYTFLEELKGFLKQRNVMGLSVAIIIALFLATFIKSLVDNILLPLVASILPSFFTWEDFTLGIFRIGAFIADFITFILVALVIILLVKLTKRFRID
jgi:large conductance mechanosensitive channel